MTFEIKEVSTVRGTFWTVIATDDDGTVLGGDSHWLRREFAVRARALYLDDSTRHGTLCGRLPA